jgi:hypothetical protein
MARHRRPRRGRLVLSIGTTRRPEPRLPEPRVDPTPIRPEPLTVPTPNTPKGVYLTYPDGAVRPVGWSFLGAVDGLHRFAADVTPDTWLADGMVVIVDPDTAFGIAFGQPA